MLFLLCNTLMVQKHWAETVFQVVEVVVWFYLASYNKKAPPPHRLFTFQRSPLPSGHSTETGYWETAFCNPVSNIALFSSWKSHMTLACQSEKPKLTSIPAWPVEGWGSLLVLSSRSLIKCLTATTTEDWVKGGGWRAREDKRCRDLRAGCGTGVLALRPLRIESASSGHVFHGGKKDALFVSLGDEARVWFSRVRGHRGWTQPTNLLSVLLEEISLISRTTMCYLTAKRLPKKTEAFICIYW